MRNPFDDEWQGLPEQQSDDFDASALEEAIRARRAEEFAALSRTE